MEINYLFRNGLPSIQQKSMEQTDSIRVPDSRVAIAAYLMSILRYD